jgi:hypothetical protein
VDLNMENINQTDEILKLLFENIENESINDEFFDSIIRINNESQEEVSDLIDLAPTFESLGHHLVKPEVSLPFNI